MHYILHILRGLSDAMIATLAAVILGLTFAWTFAPVYGAIPVIANGLGH